MNCTEYSEEIEIIKKQNCVELEIYPLAAELIAPTLIDLSKRYVSQRRKSDFGKIYYGISSFPDIAILDRDFDNKVNKEISEENWDKLRGCIEVKNLDEELYDLEDLKEAIRKGCGKNEQPLTCKQINEIGQLFGEILWYKKYYILMGYNGKCSNLLLQTVIRKLF